MRSSTSGAHLPGKRKQSESQNNREHKPVQGTDAAVERRAAGGFGETKVTEPRRVVVGNQNVQRLRNKKISLNKKKKCCSLTLFNLLRRGHICCFLFRRHFCKGEERCELFTPKRKRTNQIAMNDGRILRVQIVHAAADLHRHRQLDRPAQVALQLQRLTRRERGRQERKKRKKRLKPCSNCPWRRTR